MTVRLTAAALLVVLAGPGRAAQAPEPAWLDREAVDAGEIQVRTDRDGGTITVQTAALIDAPAEAIWNVLKSCEVAPDYVPNIVSCESVEVLDDGKAELFVQTIKPIFFIPRFEHVFRLDYHPYERIDVTRVSGPIERMDGNWRLLRGPEGPVLLVHSLDVNPGFPIPRFMLRASMRRNLEKIMEAVRARAEARAEVRSDDAGPL